MGYPGVYPISAEEKEAVQKALLEVEKGKIINDEEANAEIEEWLESK